MTHLLGRAGDYMFLVRSRQDSWYDAHPNPVEGNPGCGCSKRGEEDPGQGNHLLAMAALGRGLPAEATIDQAAAKPVAIVTAAAAPRS